MLGARLPRVHPALSPARGGWSTTPRRFCGSRSTAHARGAGRGRASAVGDRHHEPARDRGAVGPRGRSRRSHPRSSGRTGAPPSAAASCAAGRRGAMLRERTGLVADPYFSATKLEWLLRDARICARRAERASSPAGRSKAGWSGQLTGGRVHATDPTNASRTLLYDIAARDWDAGAAASSSACRARCCRKSCRRRASSARPMPEHLGVRASDRRPRGRSAGGAVRPGLLRRGLAKNTYGTGAFLLVYTGRAAADAARTACSPPSRAARGRAGLCARGQRLHRRRGDAVAARRARHHRARPGDRGARPQRARHRRRPLRARLRRARRAALGARGARHHRRASPAGPRGRTWCVRRSRRWRSAAPRCSRRWRAADGLDGRGAAGGRRRGGERLADAVSGGRARASRSSDRTWWRRRRSVRPGSPASRSASGRGGGVPGWATVPALRADDGRFRAAGASPRLGASGGGDADVGKGGPARPGDTPTD